MINFKAKLTTILVTSAAALSFSAIRANADTTYTIQSGDTLSKIATKFNTNVNVLAQTNKISNVNLIYTGRQLLIASQAPATSYQAPAIKTPASAAPVQKAYVPAASYQAPAQAPARSYQTASVGGAALQRRQIESGNNYNTFTGNGYLGAYQFARGTWAAGVAAVGGSVSDTSAAHQDAVANWYANSRYGGWQNVPTHGGW